MSVQISVRMPGSMGVRRQTLVAAVATLLVGLGAGLLLTRDGDISFSPQTDACEKRGVVGRSLVCLD